MILFQIWVEEGTVFGFTLPGSYDHLELTMQNPIAKCVTWFNQTKVSECSFKTRVPEMALKALSTAAREAGKGLTLTMALSIT